ncbi:MAG: hypothetical protein Q3Y08_00620 [Butyricicoccus sp.]|nr:hypothetical protein [Butyricicoccus sp.]
MKRRGQNNFRVTYHQTFRAYPTDSGKCGRIPSFEQEAAKGVHISDREQGLNGEGMVIRHYVPVKHQREEQFCSVCLQYYKGVPMVYRIGGDEFVVKSQESEHIEKESGSQ